MEEALRQPDRAYVEALVPAGEDQLGRAAADVEDEDPAFECAYASSRQLRLLVPAEDVRYVAVGRLHGLGERGAVPGVPDSARRDRERSLGPEPVDLAPVLGERSVDSLLRRAAASGGSQHLRRAGSRSTAERRRRSSRAFDVADEQPRRVGADVDRGDAGHLRGTTLRRGRRGTDIARGAGEHGSTARLPAGGGDRARASPRSPTPDRRFARRPPGG